MSMVIVFLMLMTACQKDEPGELSANLVLKSANTDPVNPVGRYIVIFKNEVSDPDLATEELKVKFNLNPGQVYRYCLKGFSASVPSVALPGLMDNPLIEYIEEDMVISASAQTVPTGIRRIRTDLHPFADIDGDGGDMDVDVAVIDTGVDPGHPDLNVADGVHYFNMGSEDSLYNDDNGHGTHVAGTIGARDNTEGVAGVAPGARIWAVKVLAAGGSGYLSDILKGIDWVRARANDIEVINMSLGGKGYSQSYRTAIASCVDAGIVVVVSAGNDGIDIYGRDGTFGTADDCVPAAFPETAAISALADSDGKPGGLGFWPGYGPDDSFASFSNFSASVIAENPVNSPGKAIDLIMPGVEIYSTWLNGGYASMTGTSMAAPHAAGLAALYIAEHGRAHNAAEVVAIRQLMIDQGRQQTDPEGLAHQNDPDGNPEKLGWAYSGQVSVEMPPVADAGADQTLNDADGSGEETATLNGSASTDDLGIISWSWSENGVILSTEMNPVIPFPTGIHEVILEVTDQMGQTATDRLTVTVVPNQAPVAGWDYTASGLTVAFFDRSADADGTLTAWNWDFGDGGVSGLQNPGHTWSASGTYRVTLTVTDNGMATSALSADVTVTAPIPEMIVLEVTVFKDKNLNRAELSWTNASTPKVDVWCNNKLIKTVTDTGSFTDESDKKSSESNTYQIRENGGIRYSNTVTVGL
jgi:subtilisin family serine protease